MMTQMKKVVISITNAQPNNSNAKATSIVYQNISNATENRTVKMDQMRPIVKHQFAVLAHVAKFVWKKNQEIIIVDAPMATRKE